MHLLQLSTSGRIFSRAPRGDRADLLVANDALSCRSRRSRARRRRRSRCRRGRRGRRPTGRYGLPMREPAGPSSRLVLVVEPDDRHALAPGELDQQRMLLAARHAPRRPDVEQPHLALHVGRRERLARAAQLRRARTTAPACRSAATELRADPATGRRAGSPRGRRNTTSGSSLETTLLMAATTVRTCDAACACKRASRRARAGGNDGRQREEAAERHQHASAPDPVTNGL